MKKRKWDRMEFQDAFRVYPSHSPGGWHLGSPTQPSKLPSGTAQMPSRRTFPQVRPQPWNQQVFVSPESPSTGERGFLVSFAPATQGRGEIPSLFGSRGRGTYTVLEASAWCLPGCWLRGQGAPGFPVQSNFSVRPVAPKGQWFCLLHQTEHS